MTFTVRIRGSSSALILADYLCEHCGPFETLVERPAPDDVPCDACAAPSSWLPCAPLVRRPLVLGVHKGKSDPMPFPEAMDTEPLADGMSLNDWRKRRAKIWNDKDWKDWKKEMR